MPDRSPMSAPDTERPAFGLCRYSVGGGLASSGIVFQDRIVALAALVKPHDPLRGLLAGTIFDMLQIWDVILPAIRDVREGLTSGSLGKIFDALSVPADSVILHSPIERPGAIYLAGANFREHIVEMLTERFGREADGTLSESEIRAKAIGVMEERASHNAPFLFNKNGISMNGPHDPVVLPHGSQQIDWELEPTVVIGRRAWRVDRENAFDYVAGFAVGNDISARDRLWRKGAIGIDAVQSKGLEGFFPFGPYLVMSADVPDPANLSMTLKLNGALMQDGNTSDMIYGFDRLIEYLSQWVPLLPGDIITGGSPPGNGAPRQLFLKAGDVTEASITGLGTQRTNYLAASD